jgi:hypothetical protein
LDIYQEIIDEQIHRTERMEITGRPIPRDLALYPYEDDTTLCEKLETEMFNERSDEEWYKLHPAIPEPIRQTSEIAKADVDDRLTRDCFIYLDPKPPEDQFAQCSTCRLWRIHHDLCSIHGPEIKVTGDMSCALYIHGDPRPVGANIDAVVTPIESGLVDRQVRCENCQWFYESDQCNLFDLLNKAHPHEFNLDTKVHPKGCCNAQQPKTETD